MRKAIKNLKLVLIATIVILSTEIVKSQDTITITTYNLLKFSTNSTNRTPYFKAIIDSLQPDILVCQEMISLDAYNLFYNEVTDTTYSQGEFIDGPDTDNAIFYKHEKFEYLSHTAIPTTLRNISEFKLVHHISKDTLYIFSVHLKAGNSSSDRQRRADEVL